MAYNCMIYKKSFKFYYVFDPVLLVPFILIIFFFYFYNMQTLIVIYEYVYFGQKVFLYFNYK